MTRLSLITLLALLAVAVPLTPTNAQTQIDMQDKACDDFKKADAELNKAYKKILYEYKHDKVFIEKLKKAQKAWLTYRDAHIESIYPVEDKASEYGSVYGMCYCTAKKELTEQRTKMLKQWVDGVVEGDVCSGSQKFHDSEEDKLSEAIYLHNKAVLDSNRNKYGARYQPEDYVVDKNSYRYTFVDLNGDNISDAIVLFEDAESCGTGGCNMEIYRGTKTGFEYLSGSTITLPPIRVMSENRQGWKTLIVSSGGTGNVLMKFNGSRYPLNPSLQPKATPSAIKSAVTVLEQK